MGKTGTPSSGSQTVDRALQLMDVLAERGVPLRLSELAKAVNLNISTTSRLLSSLEHYGYVQRDASTGRYLLGYRLLHLAQVAQEESGLAELAIPILATLVEATGETATITVLQGNRAMVIARVVCSNQLRITAPIGTLGPLYCTAAGKALLAYRRDEEIDYFLTRGMPRLTDATITDIPTMRGELQRVRVQGYALDRGEREEGLIGLATPVHDGSGAVIASCGISGAGQRMTEERMPDLARHVVEAGNNLSARLGFRPVTRTGVAAVQSRR